MMPISFGNLFKNDLRSSFLFSSLTPNAAIQSVCRNYLPVPSSFQCIQLNSLSSGYVCPGWVELGQNLDKPYYPNSRGVLLLFIVKNLCNVALRLKQNLDNLTNAGFVFEMPVMLNGENKDEDICQKSPTEVVLALSVLIRWNRAGWI